MNSFYSFNIPPVAKGRVKFSTRGGFARAYTPLITRNYETMLKTLAKRMHGKRELFKGPLRVRVCFQIEKPKSVKNRKYPIVKPDLDNFLKCLDSFNGIIWEDDSQIIQIVSEKLYAIEDPCIELEVSRLD